MAKHYNILNCPFALHLWDTAGQERFQSIAKNYYRGADAVVLAYDMGKCASLDSCRRWLDQAKEYTVNPHAFVYLVGTKLDLIDVASFGYNAVSGTASDVARDLRAEYWEVSSATGENVEALFERIAVKCMEEKCLRWCSSRGGHGMLDGSNPRLGRKIGGGEELMGGDGTSFIHLEMDEKKAKGQKMANCC